MAVIAERHPVKDIKGAEKARIITLSVISDKEGRPKGRYTRGGDTIRRRLLGIRRRLCDRPVGIHRGDFHTDPRSQTGYVGLSLSRRRRRGAHRKKEGNKLRIYPSERHAAYTCVNLDENIRSAKGNTLGENLSFKVDIRPLLPSVEFVDEGVIVPQSGKVAIPFSAVYLRGVQVRVIKVLEKNMGQFLQECDIDGNSEIMRVGRLVALKTVILGQQDDPGLTKRKIYALDITDLVDPEPGAVYRGGAVVRPQPVGLPPLRRRVADTLSDEQIKASDEALFKSEASRFDNYGSYYYRYTDWSGYDYKQSDNPCSGKLLYRQRQRHWQNILVTDIGLIAMAGDEGNLYGTGP